MLKQISECTTTAHLAGQWCPHMHQGCMLIDRGCGLRSAISVRAVEVERCDTMLTKGAFECGVTIHRFGCVISHIFIVVPLAA
jgi:hypothetical protein